MSRKIKCPYCLEGSYTKEDLIDHIDHNHRDMIPQGWTAGRLAFKIINKKDHGSCVVCKKETPWNEKRCKYQRLCGNPKCRAALREAALKNHIKVYKVPTLLTDPEHQQEMLTHRRIAGEYKFSDGGKIGYVGSYEKKFLEFMDKVLEIPSSDLMEPGPTLEYDFNGKKHVWITDFLYIPYNLIIEIKDGGNNPNRTNMPITRQKTIYKEKMITELGIYNYIRLTNNDFVQLLDIFAELKMQMLDDEPENRKAIIHINEGVIEEAANQREALEEALKKHPMWDKIKNNEKLEDAIDKVLVISKGVGDFSIDIAVLLVFVFTIQTPLFFATLIQTVLELPVALTATIARVLTEKKSKPNILPVRTNHLPEDFKMLCLNTHPLNSVIGSLTISAILAAIISPSRFLSMFATSFKWCMMILMSSQYEARDILVVDTKVPLTDDSTSLAGSKEATELAKQTDIVAVNDGLVIWSESTGLYEKEITRKISRQIRPAGNCVIILHDVGSYSLYGHMQNGSIKVKAGQRVKQGDVLGKMGNSGNSTEYHLHFEMSFTCPIGQFVSIGKPLTDFEFKSIDMSILTLINIFKINDYLKRNDYNKKRGHLCEAGFIKEA